LKRSKLQEKRWLRCLEEMKEKWGNKFNMLRAGNEKADQLAQEGTKEEKPPLYSRLMGKEKDIGVYHKGQWVDSSICKHLTQIKNSNYARDQKKRICEGITDPKGVAWKVAFTITQKANFKDDTNARTIYKLRTPNSQLNQHIKKQLERKMLG